MRLNSKNKLGIITISAFAFYWYYLRFAVLELSKAYRFTRSYNNTIKTLCKRYNYPYPSIVSAIIMTESYANPTAQGNDGEVGLMQILPKTFSWLYEYYDFNFEFNTLYDPTNNIVVGIHLLKYLRSKGLSIQNQIKAYNVGEDLKPMDKAEIYYQKVMRWI